MKEIKHYVLPQHTNELYKNEAISSISLTKEVASKINELVDAYNELNKTNLAKIQEQDGKIRKGILYMKDNLINTIHDLLENYKETGKLDGIITEAVLNELNELREVIYPIGNVKRYGAKGDGEHDDTIPLFNAIIEAKENDKPLIIEDGKYLINKDLSARYIKSIDIKGEIISPNNSVLEVGGNSTDGSGYKININKCNNIKVIGLKNSILNIDHCDLLHLVANGDDEKSASIGYCQFYGAYVKELIIESFGSNIGWINENTFRIKRIEKVTIKGNYTHNNNRFEHINFEKGILNLENARNNYFSGRCEGGITINASNDSQSNFIEKEYYYRHYFGDNITEDAFGSYSYQYVNKLQNEKELLLIDKNSEKFPVKAFLFEEDGTFKGNNYNEIFHSNLIKIDKTFCLKVNTDQPNIRVQLNFYDENKNRITSKVDNFADGRMTYQENNDWSYMINANVSEDSVTFFPGVAKYVEYKVIFGSNANVKMNYVSVRLIKLVTTDIYITNNVESGIYTSVPTQGYFKQGTRLYAKSPKAGSGLGIICVESGTPGVWKNFGSIAS